MVLLVPHHDWVLRALGRVRGTSKTVVVYGGET